jgi:glycosyltransferase involved in cell wall biosynthesis
VSARELPYWLGSADLFLIPLLQGQVNDYYRHPGKLGEYLAAGRPVVAPDLGETGRLIREERIGLVATPDLTDLDERICDLIEQPDLSDRLGSQARKVAEGQFALPVLAERLEQFIGRLQDESKARGL